MGRTKELMKAHMHNHKRNAESKAKPTKDDTQVPSNEGKNPLGSQKPQPQDESKKNVGDKHGNKN